MMTLQKEPLEGGVELGGRVVRAPVAPAHITPDVASTRPRSRAFVGVLALFVIAAFMGIAALGLVLAVDDVRATAPFVETEDCNFIPDTVSCVGQDGVGTIAPADLSATSPAAGQQSWAGASHVHVPIPRLWVEMVGRLAGAS